MDGFGITLAKRVCSFCRGNEGLRLWPWSGRVFGTTHTRCRRCAERQKVRFAAQPPGATAA